VERKMIKITLNDFLKLPKEQYSSKLLCFITDTVFGLGVVDDEFIEVGLNKIYSLKQRDSNKPISLLVPSIDSVIDKIIFPIEFKYLSSYWPGALTVIFKKKSNDYFSWTKRDTIGIRIPNSEVALKVLNHLGPIATTSVNISGEKELNTIDEIVNEFKDSIDYIVTDVSPLSKVPSTVVDISSGKLVILRCGEQVIENK